MADVSIRFNVQNAEVVRQALLQLGKDGEKALQQLNAGTAAPNRGLNALSSLIDEAKGRVTGLATSIGPAGSALIQLGPAGLAAAAALGAVASAFTRVGERARETAEWAKQVKEAAATAGLTIEQVQALQFAANQAGVDVDKSSQFFNRLTVAVEELRRGSGPLVDALARIDIGLAREVAAARTTAEAIDAIARAYARLETAGQHNALVAAIGGRGALGVGAVLEGVAGAGGFAGLEARARSFGKVLSTEVVGNMDRLRLEIAELEGATSKAWDRALSKLFGAENLEQQKAWAEIWRSVAGFAERWADALSRAKPVDDPAAIGSHLGLGSQRGARPTPALPGFEEMQRGIAGLGAMPETPLATDLGLMRRWMQAAPEAATVTDQLNRRLMELRVANEDGAISADKLAAAEGRVRLAHERQIEGMRASLGLYEEQAALARRMKEIDDLYAQGVIKNAEERARAERNARREVEQMGRAMAVRNSNTPGLTGLALEAQDLTRLLDQGLTSALRGSAATMREMLTGTKSLSAGFAELATRIADAVTEALIMRSIVGPISGAIGSGISGLAGGGGAGGWTTTVIPSAHGNAFWGGRLTAFAAGGIVTRPTIFAMANGMGLMGEAGPEAVMPLRRLGSGRLGVEAAGGGANVQVIVNNNASGAKATTREQSDGRGGRRIEVMIDEMVAGALGRPGSMSRRMLSVSGGMTRL